MSERDVLFLVAVVVTAGSLTTFIVQWYRQRGQKKRH